LDVDRLQITCTNLKTEQTKIVELVDLSKAALKFQMGYDVEQPISLVDSLNDDNLQAENLLQNSFDPSNRIETKLLNRQIELNQLQLKAREWAWIPNLVAIGSYSVNHYANDFDFYKKNSQYYPTTVIGISMGATLFDGLQNFYKKQEARLEILKNKNDLYNLNNALKLELANSKISLKSALLSIQSQKSNLTLADEVARVSKIKYQQGVGSSLEVLSAETALKEAQTNYLSALYDAYVAKVNYEKATGTLIK
jgi:outer membrane protein